MSTKEITMADLENLKKAWLLLDATVLLNLCAEEEIVFGHVKRGEKAPCEKYLADLNLQHLAPQIVDEELEGSLINKGIIEYDDIEPLYYELYGGKVSYIFGGAPLAEDLDDEDDAIMHFKGGLYEYLKDLYTIFKEIITTEVTPELFASLPEILDKEEQRVYYTKISEFIAAIKLKKLKKNSKVDKYLKDLPFISPLIMRLIQKQKDRYLLINNDPDSLDYKLALLSCFRFYNEDNAKLFELKILRWEEQINDSLQQHG